MPDLINPDKAAELLKVSPQWVRKLLQRGEIEGQKLGRNWVITKEALDAYKAERNKGDSAKK